MSQHEITITLSPGVRTNLTITELLWQMLPHSKRGDEQKFIRTAIVTLHHAHFKHLRLTLGEYLADICEKFGETQTSVLRTAIAFHAGKHNNQATRSNPAAQHTPHIQCSVGKRGEKDKIMSTIKSAWKIEDIAVGKTVRLATRIMESGKKAYFFFDKNNPDSSTGFDKITLSSQMVDDLIKIGWTTR